MRQALSIHPQSRCRPVTSIEVEVARSSPGSLALTYCLTGSTGDLYLPTAARPMRADELWRRTCFEAFVRAPPDESYLEFNFAPSTSWAAYSFTGYRAGMEVASEISSPQMDVRTSGASFELRVSLDLGRWATATWGLGLSAVIEEANGAISYWALTHPAGKPDFHHSQSFVLELSRPESS